MPIDYSKYPANWKSEIVPRILKRADNKCEICGLPNKSTVFAMQFYMRSNENGRYGYRSIWFRIEQDALKVSHLGIKSKIRVVLTVAHLDHDETNKNIKDDRLKAMCQHCHLNYDAKEKYRRACKSQTDFNKELLNEGY